MIEHLFESDPPDYAILYGKSVERACSVPLMNEKKPGEHIRLGVTAQARPSRTQASSRGSTARASSCATTLRLSHTLSVRCARLATSGVPLSPVLVREHLLDGGGKWTGC
jgi:hypothetical protein